MQSSQISWSLISEPGDAMAGLLRRTLGSEQALEIISKNTAKEIFSLLPEDDFRSPRFLVSLEESLECWRRRLKVINHNQAMDKIFELGGSFITPLDELWPNQLDDLGDSSPAGLWVLGDVSQLQKQPAISVIGSRLASEYGLNLTAAMIRYSISKNWLIVSGGALGIDAMASLSAIQNGGKTIAVMAGGLDQLYPKSNFELFDQIKVNGALISELAPGSAPSRWRFLQRNRLIAALGQATLVVEAGFRSGSINTAGHANELGRPVGAVPGPIDSVRSAGCHRLIREGRAELIATPGHLLELMGETVKEEGEISKLTHLQIRVLDAFQGRTLSVGDVATVAGITLEQTKLVLSELLAKNLVGQSSQGYRKH